MAPFVIHYDCRNRIKPIWRVGYQRLRRQTFRFIVNDTAAPLTRDLVKVVIFSALLAPVQAAQIVQTLANLRDSILAP